MRKPNSGQFRPGPDPRRHRFSRDECVKGFWGAIFSIVERHPDAIGADGKHIAFHFLRSPKKVRAQKSDCALS